MGSSGYLKDLSGGEQLLEFLDAFFERGELLLGFDEVEALGLVGLELVTHVLSGFIEADLFALQRLLEAFEAAGGQLGRSRHG
ncbi:hypothetical protein ASF71_20675 [Deinococcus sp. Leaf326]|nr:hypothetical protein ASF71_20675 [Deinococcus sp. Leaf326]